MASMVAATITYLDEASALLATSSPSVAASLHSSCLARAAESGQREPAHGDGRQNCQSCGTVLIPGWTCQTPAGSGPRKPRTRQDRLENSRKTKDVTLRCSMCSAINVFEAKKPTKRTFRKSPTSTKSTTSNPKPAPPAMPSPVAPSEQTGARKRARNKKSSLQSILADRKSVEQQKGFGLDIMDFMKK